MFISKPDDRDTEIEFDANPAAGEDLGSSKAKNTVPETTISLAAGRDDKSAVLGGRLGGAMFDEALRGGSQPFEADDRTQESSRHIQVQIHRGRSACVVAPISVLRTCRKSKSEYTKTRSIFLASAGCEATGPKNVKEREHDDLTTQSL
ncbi:hypothetical protein SO078_30905 (plasmid) [Sinorhizobium meliloti]|uniref:hypothetical protein n=1 Tax=Rhizobium meliloti TaxID=382 RepID=UPI000FD8493C|nr:hypothetical protein [Sinorhizobium meliloti]MDX0574970.1 hypothetical protein [Sinorhizobium medicae]MCO6425564.1 hypothetical protein [Sinorhizobium meliloti]MDX0673861.1 hypothetical protein [Sinorhizobium medicae]MDX0711002.1 hypothetical protein [Sinorhizobium medicae]RVL31633.1 hypothetical protein CN148_25815 [Sinorhizobium meliloti]